MGAAARPGRHALRRRFARAAAVFGAVSVVAPFRLAHAAAEGETYGWFGYAVLLYPLIAVAVGLSLAFATGRVSQRWAIGAIAIFVVVGIVGGGAAYFAAYGAALLLMLAVAAGEPLPPPDLDDPRLRR